MAGGQSGGMTHTYLILIDAIASTGVVGGLIFFLGHAVHAGRKTDRVHTT
jgi:hypothetical protein